MSCLPLAGDCLLAFPVAAPSHMRPRAPIAITLLHIGNEGKPGDFGRPSRPERGG